MTSHFSRRKFLAATLAAGAATSCVTPRNESVGMIDAHTHFYDPTRPQGVPWPSKEDRFLYRAVLPAELKEIATPLGVTGTVVVEASPWEEDNQWVLDLAKRDPFIFGLVGHLKPGRTAFASELERFAANPLFRGIRTGLWSIPVRPENSEFLRDLQLLAERNLTLDLLGGPEQVLRITQLAGAVPELRIVVDHCAGVRVDGKVPDREWTAGIRALAAHPNVFMKVSGLVEGTGLEQNAPADVEFYRPVLETIWDAYGEDRLIFGSNWPVSARFAEYETVLKIVYEYFSGKGKTAFTKYFRSNAERVYGLRSRA